MRDVIRVKHEIFPSGEIAADLQGTPDSLSFKKDDLEALLDSKYNGLYTFPLLAMFYPSLDFRHKLHQDHIHPRSHFTTPKLNELGVPVELHEEFKNRVDLIPNLQLLEGQPNIEKSAIAFGDWVGQKFADPNQRSDYLKRNFIPEVGYEFRDFLHFFAERRLRLLEVLRRLVGIDDTANTEEGDESGLDSEAAGFHAECMANVARHLQTVQSAVSKTWYASEDDSTRTVCVVSKRYLRGQQSRYWCSIHPEQVEFLQGLERSYIAFGCGGAELTVLIPAAIFLPKLAAMRQTQTEAGRSYWHVDLFGDSEHLELGQPLLNRRDNVTKFILPS